MPVEKDDEPDSSHNPHHRDHPGNFGSHSGTYFDQAKEIMPGLCGESS